MTERPRFNIHCADHIGFAVVSLDEALRFWVEGLGGVDGFDQDQAAGPCDEGSVILCCLLAA